MMFKFVVKYLGFLKHGPLIAHVVDAWMMLWTITFNKQVLRAIENIEDEVSMWKGVTCSTHKYGGLQFNYSYKEIGHIHSNGVLDILFDSKTKCDLILQCKVDDHHSFVHSGWTSFYIGGVEDSLNAIELLRMSYKRVRRTRGDLNG